MSKKRRKAPETRARLPAAERRAQIVERSIEVFAERGLTGTTSAALAKACGVSEALLFRLFGDKEGLFAAIIQRVVERGEEVFPADAAEQGDDEAFFRRMAGYVLRRGREDPAFVRLLLYSALEGHPLARRFSEARGARVVGFVADHIRRRVAEGAFRPVDADLVARGFLGMVHQVNLARYVYRVPGPDGDDEVIAAELAALALGGLVSRRAAAPPGSAPARARARGPRPGP
ncbi:MAG: TetR/AcrR family transcriptional regulator [Planctomycetes bacterium]|nr:TetR/AcrR family transcriptional regulator [Planctomycetota bacterium]